MREQPGSSLSTHQTVSFLGVALGIACGVATAQDKLLPPPYQIAGANLVIVGVVWDEVAVRKALPPGITPVKEMTGAITYQSRI
jgi:hypothetical protein